jgi:hypothetical protein
MGREGHLSSRTYEPETQLFLAPRRHTAMVRGHPPAPTRHEEDVLAGRLHHPRRGPRKRADKPGCNRAQRGATRRTPVQPGRGPKSPFFGCKYESGCTSAPVSTDRAPNCNSAPNSARKRAESQYFTAFQPRRPPHHPDEPWGMSNKEGGGPAPSPTPAQHAGRRQLMTSSSPSTSTETVSPSVYLPSRRARAKVSPMVR